ncbi:MAG: type II toxin-antitoxin system prevent-host-death family antitoxin [bacterium]|nr:type II toxin-antitoxin system prevent-host-death family antitoxin [bacterium]
MTRQVTATQAKAQILALLDDMAAGDEIEITKHGRTVARLVPAKGPAALRGRFAGVAVSVADEDLPFSTGADWEFDGSLWPGSRAASASVPRTETPSRNPSSRLSEAPPERADDG